MAAEFAELRPEEHLVEGSWEEGVGSVHDATDRRIFWLVSRRLTLVATAEGGWRQLFRDPRDGRLWELTFPHGSLHGGGPRRLECVPARRARERYGPLVD